LNTILYIIWFVVSMFWAYEWATTDSLEACVAFFGSVILSMLLAGDVK